MGAKPHIARIGIAAAGGYFSRVGDERVQAVDIKQLLAESGEPRPRRTSRLTDLALLGASRALGGQPDLAPDGAVVLGSGQSGRCDTARMLASILESGDAPMPFDFINVSNNMAGYYVARRYRLQGPNLAVSRRDSAFEGAAEIALQQLERGAVPLVLLGSVDESCRQPAVPGCVLKSDAATAAEGSSWLLLLGGTAVDRCDTWIESHRHFADWSRVSAYLDADEDLPGATVIASERVALNVREVSSIGEHLWLAGAEDCPSGSAHALVWALGEWRNTSNAYFVHGDEEAGYLLLRLGRRSSNRNSLLQ
jgi:hypothetical protein